MGDNLYQVPVVSLLAQQQGPVYLRTPWPQFYRHIPQVIAVRSETRLRTQAKNVSASTSGFAPPPAKSRLLKLTYTPYVIRGTPFYQGLCLSSWQNHQRYFLQLPRDPVMEMPRRNFAIIRPCTIRQEWRCPSRNPKPEYIQWAIDHLSQRGIETVVLSDIHPPDEVYSGPRPRNATAYFEHGELSAEELLEMFWSCRLVVGPPGFLAPMAIATGTPALVIHGGAGGLNAPHLIDAPGQGSLSHVLPDNHCMCRDRKHTCDKQINLCKLKQALDDLLVSSLPKKSPSQTIGAGMTASVSYR